MLHDHPRGEPDGGVYWCKACIFHGISTADEIAYEKRDNRSRIRIGMTVSWTQNVSRNLAEGYRSVYLTGQVWSRAAPQLNGHEFWWIVTEDQRYWHVHQNNLKIKRTSSDVCSV